MRFGTARSWTLFDLRFDVLHVRHERFALARHFHDGTYNVGVVTGGTNVYWYNGKVREGSTGTLCVADPGEVHDGGLGSDPWTYVGIAVPAEAFSIVADEMTDDHPHFSDVVPASSPAAVAFSTLAELFVTNADLGLIKEAAVLALRQLVDGHAANRSIPCRSACNRTARMAVEAINDQYGCDVDLTTLARITGASRFQVLRSVSAAVGLSPHALATQRRVERALAFARDGMSLAEAACAAGFCDQSHMTRAVRRQTGVTPGALRTR